MHKLAQVFGGWSGYQTSLVQAVAPLTGEQLSWRPAPDRRSLGEIVRHLSLGRITWFARMGGPGIEDVVARIPAWYVDADGSRHVREDCVPSGDPAAAREWLELSWRPIQRVLEEWTVDDLGATYTHRFRGTDYAVSRQWTIWRILSHDMHHGGQIALLLALQGMDAFELRVLGGHIISPPLASAAANQNHSSPFELSREEMRELGYRVVDLLTEHLATLPEQRVGAKAVPEQIYAQLSGPPPEHGIPCERLLEQLRRDILPHTMHVNHPRFFAFVPGPGNYISVMADAVAAGYNVFAGTWLGGSAAEAVETVTVGWLRQLCGFDENCRGLFVSGGTMANLTALAVARHVMLDDVFENAVVYMSDQAHSSLEKALNVLGFRPKQIVRLPCDDDFRLRVSDVALRIGQDRERGLRPFCVIASAGTTNTGAVDPLPELRALCDAERLWLHVDGAYGAASIISEEGRAVLQGLELADSLSLDPHKWLYQPFGAGCVLVRRGEELMATFRILPDYLQDVHRNDEEINYTDMGIELSRGFRALKLWMSVKTFGLAAFRESIGRAFRLAQLAERTLREMSDWEISSPAQMAVVCFRYRPGDNALHARVVEAMLEDGYALCTSTTLRGRTVLRMCTINPLTTDDDIVTTVKHVNELALRARNGI